MTGLAIAFGILAVCAIIWAVDCHRARRRASIARAEPCEEDKALDALAGELDRILEEHYRRRRRPAIAIARGLGL